MKPAEILEPGGQHAMSTPITFKGRIYSLQQGETVLDALQRGGAVVPSSCRSGVCQSCLMRASEGVVPPHAQSGLKTNQRERGFFLACQCRPHEPLTVGLPDEQDQARFVAKVIETQALNPTVHRIRLAIPERYPFRAGQFIRLYRDDATRCYSVASLPGEPFLELHVKDYPGGHFSSWLCHDVQVGDDIILGEAAGDCFYAPERPEQPLLMVATGTGLAPMWGVIRDALSQGHRGEIHLFHGSYVRDGLYYIDELTKLAAQHPNVHYYPCVSDDPLEQNARQGQADVQALQQFPKLSGWRVFLCGNPDMVNATKRKAFLAGASLKDILADPFIVTTPPAAAAAAAGT